MVCLRLMAVSEHVSTIKTITDLKQLQLGLGEVCDNDYLCKHYYLLSKGKMVILGVLLLCN